MLDNFEQKYTVILLSNSYPPHRFMLLKRAANREFAPNMYTGFGGKFEHTESPKECALRELFEETGIKNVNLTEIGRINTNNKKLLCYFFGVTKVTQVADSPEGQMEWVDISNLFSLDIIVSTKIFMENWQKRDFAKSKAFSMLFECKNLDDPTELPSEITFKEGLRE